MRRRVVLVGLATLGVLAVPALAAAASGEITPAKPLTLSLEGPATIPITVRVIPTTKAKQVPELWLDLLLDGKKIRRVGGPPNATVALSIKVPAGTHVAEIRAKDPRIASASVAWTLPTASVAAAKTPSSPPPAAKAAPAVTPPTATVAVPSPASTPASSNARPATASAGGDGRWIEVGALFYTRVSALRYQPAAPGISVTGLEALPGRPVAVGASIGWRHMAGKRAQSDYAGRVLPSYVVDVDAVPMEGIARGLRPAGAWTGWVEGGIGAEFAKSSYARADLVPTHRIENDWAFTGSLRAGASRPLGGGTLGISIGARAARHAFRDHNFEVLHGVETQVAWGKRF